MSDEPTPGQEPVLRRRLRITVLATAGLFVLQIGWLLVMPPATGIDEFDHVYRTSSVALGHWKPGSHEVASSLARGAMLPVRADVAEAAGPACAELPYTKPFNCRPYKDLGNGVVEIATGTDYYNPLYYGVVGTLARPWRGNAAIDAMRIATLAACTLMFGLALFLTTAWARTRWPTVLLLASCLPTTVYSSSIATPNGVQMVSGTLVWAALVSLLHPRSTGRSVAYVGLMAGVAVMANTHTLGLLWLALGAVTVAVYAGVGKMLTTALPRSRLEVVMLAVAVAAVAFQLWWMAYARPNVSRPEGGLAGSPWGRIAESVILWPLQAVAAFPYRNQPAPAVVYGIAAVILIALAVMTARALRGQLRLAAAIVVILGLTIAVPVGITYAGFHQYGLSWQGRYGMPYSVGLFILAAVALDERGRAIGGAILWGGAVGWGAAHMLGTAGVLREMRADHALVNATGWWAPPMLLVVALGLVATALWCRSLDLSGDRHISELLADAPASPNDEEINVR